MDWLKDGNINSAYFHKSKGRINRNIVGSICDEDGVKYEGNKVAEDSESWKMGLLTLNN